MGSPPLARPPQGGLALGLQVRVCASQPPSRFGFVSLVARGSLVLGQSPCAVVAGARLHHTQSGWSARMIARLRLYSGSVSQRVMGSPLLARPPRGGLALGLHGWVGGSQPPSRFGFVSLVARCSLVVGQSPFAFVSFVRCSTRRVGRVVYPGSPVFYGLTANANAGVRMLGCCACA